MKNAMFESKGRGEGERRECPWICDGIKLITLTWEWMKKVDYHQKRTAKKIEFMNSGRGKKRVLVGYLMELR